MKFVMIAALAAVSALAYVPATEAAGIRTCKATASKCAGQAKAAKAQSQRRASYTYRTTSSSPARDWFYRRMLDN